MFPEDRDERGLECLRHFAPMEKTGIAPRKHLDRRMAVPVFDRIAKIQAEATTNQKKLLFTHITIKIKLTG